MLARAAAYSDMSLSSFLISVAFDHSGPVPGFLSARVNANPFGGPQ
jgi:hypothetical protein